MLKKNISVSTETIQKLEQAAKELRAYNLISIHAAGSGHPGGTLSVMDIAAALYLEIMNIDPENHNWPERDRIFFSAGHKAPAIYCGMAKAGFFPLSETTTLRRFGSIFQGHPHWLKLPGLEISSGSLGQGLGIAVGCAIAGKMNNKNYRVFCIMGDGEQQEGSIWESAMSAAQFKLDNLVAVVDKNKLQIDGLVEEVMNIDPLDKKYKSFGWQTITIDGHNMKEILTAFKKAGEIKGKPTVIIANTIKGKSVSFMENAAGWHGVATKDRAQLDQALKDIGAVEFSREKVGELLETAKKYQENIDRQFAAALPRFSKNYWWNKSDNMKVQMEPTRSGFGRGLEQIGNDERIITIHADISGSIKITDFETNHPERKKRVVSVGIAEQNMMQVAAGLAKEGKIPVTGTYGVFAAGRPWDQIRTSICYGNLNVKIAGAHGGVSVGADGATHQALEEITLMAVLPNMNVLVPADSIETEKATRAGILDVVGPTYIRYGREATPVVTKKETPFKFGLANIIRYRSVKPDFIDAFETIPAADYKTENEDICIIACGQVVPEAMRAAYILKEDYKIETRIVNIHTVKPVDKKAIIQAAEDTGIIITAEEHQVGGFGNIIAGVISENKNYRTPFLMSMVGVQDKFGESGGPWELMQAFELCAEYIVKKAIILYKQKKEG